ncbi:glycosyltransferase family 2 protein [Paenibacillus allorhizosphaerae]|uniref:Glucosyl-3-phosphoglycerate synthase n=1 Tax=Paenibacillus allorhizosphaerae TaxID=2849866 RepID=A0ABN7TK23_9BACL|nr:glycosyltransferase family 2 protein [Paenibacillus allorhizosphaerae]CAG7642055.1 putative glycosyltransferase [Paenibacillus allorhizosphaerae]
MAPLISVIIPAWNEEETLPSTLIAIQRVRQERTETAYEVIVVDDGSTDGTSMAAHPWADLVLQLPKNEGKGAAMHAGWQAASGSIILFLDADLAETADQFPLLLEPLFREEADLVIAALPPAVKRGGIGLVRKLAKHGVQALCGHTPVAPLSGQRAVRREVLERCGRSFKGFGVEVGMLVDTVKMGYRVSELLVPFSHRETGRDVHGWLHRGKQFYAVGQALWQCWRKPVC